MINKTSDETRDHAPTSDYHAGPIVDRITDRTARVVVLGAGHVGLPLAVAVAQAGFPTIAYDTAPEKIAALARGQSYLRDLPSSHLEPLLRTGRLQASSDPDVMSAADVLIICVPTPLNKSRDPDNSFVLDAADVIGPRMTRPQLIVLESTTFPGFTREVLLPRLMRHGRRPDVDFFLAFSPERVDPGNAHYGIRNTPKILAGISPASFTVARELYQCFVDHIVAVSSTDSAEMVKLLENTFRAVNIGLVNEIAIMCSRLGLDTGEVVAAAASKPFGFMPFHPGPGLGGHCIPVDPLYLSWKLRTLRYTPRFIGLADEINRAMPTFVEELVTHALGARRKTVPGAKILVCGVTYKRDVDDVRESPALDIIALLRRRGAEVSYSDPHLATLRLGDTDLRSVPLDQAARFDCVLITTDHSSVDYPRLVEQAQLVVDTRNATRACRHLFPDKIVSL